MWNEKRMSKETFRLPLLDPLLGWILSCAGIVFYTGVRFFSAVAVPQKRRALGVPKLNHRNDFRTFGWLTSGRG